MSFSTSTKLNWSTAWDVDGGALEGRGHEPTAWDVDDGAVEGSVKGSTTWGSVKGLVWDDGGRGL